MGLTQAFSQGIRAVVFDLAGTTLDYGSRAPAEAFVELFARHAVRVTVAQAREPMGTHKRDHIQALLNMPEVAAQWQAAKGAAPSEQDLAALYLQFIPLQVGCLERHSALIPGTLEAVDSLRDMGVCIGVTTGYNREMLEVVLGSAQLQGFEADASVCAEDVREGRPAPWMLFRAMELLGAYPPALTVAVGDTLPDIEAGLNAGAWTIGVTKTGNMLGLSQEDADALDSADLRGRLEAAESRMRQVGAHMVVESVSQCPAAVEELSRRLAEGDRPY